MSDRLVYIKNRVRSLPQKPGVYLMKDRVGRVIYIGKAKNLRKRVSSYFLKSAQFLRHSPKIRAMTELVHDIEFIETASETEALILEGKLLKEWKPKYNTSFLDDKNFYLVRVDFSETLPRFRLVRFKKEDGATYFGPFVHSKLLRKTLQEMRTEFGILLSDAKPKKMPDGTYKLYDDVRSEIYQSKDCVSTEGYRGSVNAACEFLKGKSKEWIEDLKEQMRRASENKDFERAAHYRDLIEAATEMRIKTRKFDSDVVSRSVPKDSVKELGSLLALETLPEWIECFDVSHISGTFLVASMVCFRGGLPDKKGYRRFKIKSFLGNDDYRAIEETVFRRYSSLHKEGKDFPDLVVVDGGKGQVTAALKAFVRIGKDPRCLIGLAKKEEIIVFSDGRKPLKASRSNSGLKLLQRLRDEAHRFANTYNADWRSRKIKESILEEISGLGPKAREALLAHFGDIKKIRQASVDELQEVEGIGPKIAESIHRFFALR